MHTTLSALERQVHIWCVDLRSRMLLDRRTLSLSERERATRYRAGHLRDAFVVSRGGLRTLLSKYLGSSPNQIEFAYNDQGKPSLADTSSRLRFNLSHSGKIVVYAFTLDSEIGIDVEEIRRIPEFDSIAERFFNRQEFEDLKRIGHSDLPDAFFRCWVRKEAYIKAVGGGLSIPLDSFQVSLLPDQPAPLVRFPAEETELRNWALYDFSPVPGCAGAIAVRDSNRKFLIQRRWDEESIL